MFPSPPFIRMAPPPLGGGRERFLIYFHDISCEYLLERLSLILVSRETKGGDDDVTLVELSTMLHFLIWPDSCLLDCTLKASPWRTTFKIIACIFVEYKNLLYSRPFPRGSKCITKSNIACR